MRVEPKADGSGTWTILDTAKDADDIADTLESVVEWFLERSIDWDEFYDRVESYLPSDTIGDDRIDGPFWKRARQIARKVHAESTR